LKVSRSFFTFFSASEITCTLMASTIYSWFLEYLPCASASSFWSNDSDVTVSWRTFSRSYRALFSSHVFCKSWLSSIVTHIKKLVSITVDWRSIVFLQISLNGLYCA
jgi:hypothetical protein